MKEAEFGFCLRVTAISRALRLRGPLPGMPGTVKSADVIKWQRPFFLNASYLVVQVRVTAVQNSCNSCGGPQNDCSAILKFSENYTWLY